MKTTRMLKLKDISSQFNVQKVQLDNLMREFCAAKRFSYNRLLKGSGQNETNKLLQRVFGLNKRYSEDATLQAKAIIDSQKELLVLHLEETRAKLRKTRQKIEAYKTGKKTPKQVDLKTCLEGLRLRIKKLEQKQTELQNHIENDTIPPAIFGGKKNFHARTKGHITNQEWKDLRTNQLYSRGDKTKKGNLNTRITEENDRFYLEIVDSLNTEPNNRSPRLKAEIEIPDKYFKEILDAIYPDTKGNYHPYSIEIIANKFLEFNLNDHKLKKKEVNT